MRFTPVTQRGIALLVENSAHIFSKQKSRRSVDKQRKTSGEKADFNSTSAI
jgi:hypothetical protein